VFKHLYVNQNFRGLQELVVVPNFHCGEFRLLDNHKASGGFWGEVNYLVALLHRRGAEQLVLEISYGDWIVHGADSPHYHAHIHVRFENYTVTMQTLADQDAAFGPGGCQVNTKSKELYAGDAIVPFPAEFSAKVPWRLLTTRYAVMHSCPLFKLVYSWLGSKTTGFVLRIVLDSKSDVTKYSVRCNKDNAKACKTALTTVPQQVSMCLASLPPAHYSSVRLLLQTGLDRQGQRRLELFCWDASGHNSKLQNCVVGFSTYTVCIRYERLRAVEATKHPGQSVVRLAGDFLYDRGTGRWLLLNVQDVLDDDKNRPMTTLSELFRYMEITASLSSHWA
jgi:hypothetical protein